MLNEWVLNSDSDESYPAKARGGDLGKLYASVLRKLVSFELRIVNAIVGVHFVIQMGQCLSFFYLQNVLLITINLKQRIQF